MDPPSPRQQRLAELERLAELGSGIAARRLAKAAAAAAAASEAKAPAVAAQQTPTPVDVEEAAASAELAQMLPSAAVEEAAAVFEVPSSAEFAAEEELGAEAAGADTTVATAGAASASGLADRAALPKDA